MKKWILAFLIFITVPAGCGKKISKTPKSPRLVVLMCFDQVPYEYMLRYRPLFGHGGFNRLMADGAFFVSCEYEHGYAHTSAGHASVSTGAYPSVHGIIANEWYDRRIGKEQYSVEDNDFPVIGSSRPIGRSPRRMIGTTIGDQMKISSYGKAKVFSVSNKDRSAILLGGHRPDGVYWIDDASGRFVTSTYYGTTYPAWVTAYNDTKPLDRWIGQSWTRLIDSAVYPSVEPGIASHYESYGMDTVYPHRFGDGTTNQGSYYRHLMRSPFGITPVLDFALEAVRREAMGRDDISDLLCVSLSSSDYVGHDYGAWSHEVMDVMIQSDRALTKFLDELDASIGLNNVLIAVTSDHGAGLMPESLHPRPEARRVNEHEVRERIDSAMTAKYGLAPNGKGYIAWLKEGRLYFNYNALEQKRIDKESAAAYITAIFENHVPGVFRVYTENELKDAGKGSDFIDERVQRSYFRGLSGDIYVVLRPFFLWDDNDRGADHFHPWTYDSHVPLIISGTPWIRQGRYAQRCSPIDIAPTVSYLIHCARPTGSQGRVLTEALVN